MHPRWGSEGVLQPLDPAGQHGDHVEPDRTGTAATLHPLDSGTPQTTLAPLVDGLGGVTEHL